MLGRQLRKEPAVIYSGDKYDRSNSGIKAQRRLEQQSAADTPVELRCSGFMVAAHDVAQPSSFSVLCLTVLDRSCVDLLTSANTSVQPNRFTRLLLVLLMLLVLFMLLILQILLALNSLLV
jgi:hypothetical protein